MSCANCGHLKKSHRWGGANVHGTTTWLSSCRKQDCDCQGYDWGDD